MTDTTPVFPQWMQRLRAKHVSRLALILSTLADISAPAQAINAGFTIKDIFTRISNWWNTPIAWDMPWHDVQMQTQGHAVYDLSRNFINRWNAGQMFMDIEKRDNCMQKIEATLKDVN